MDERGSWNPLAFDAAWTATTTTGQAGNSYYDVKDCQGWTYAGNEMAGNVGLVTAANADWTEYYAVLPCGLEFHLYCFQQVN